MIEVRATAQAHLVPHLTKGAAWRNDDLLVIARDEGHDVHDTDGTEFSFVHGSTFGAHPVATSVAGATIQTMGAEGVGGHVRRHGGHPRSGPSESADRHHCVRPDDRGATVLAITPPLVAGMAVLDDLSARADEVLERTTGRLASR